MAQPGHQQQIQELGDEQYADGNLHRRAQVLPRKKRRRQHLDGHQAEQPNAIAAQGQHRHRHVAGFEGAVVEQHRHQADRKNQQRQRTRQRQQDHQAQAPVQHA